MSKRQEGLVWAAMTITGPNDASGVVWALSEFFFFSCFFLVLTNVFRYYLRFKATGRAAMTVMGPNDAFGVVWALSEFSFFLRVFLILNNVYRYYLCVKATGRAGMGCDDQNGPKRRWMRRLGLK